MDKLKTSTEVREADVKELMAHLTEWACFTCNRIHPAPKSLDIRCPTTGCSGILKPSSFTERRLTVELAEEKAKRQDLEGKLSKVKHELLLLCITSCTCLTASPEVKYHSPTCIYRRINELIHKLGLNGIRD